jgi:hypothetical protein
MSRLRAALAVGLLAIGCGREEISARYATHAEAVSAGAFPTIYAWSSGR